MSIGAYESVDEAIARLTRRINYLEAKEREYGHVMTLISLLVYKDLPGEELVIRISKQAQMEGRDWKEILELALRGDG